MFCTIFQADVSKEKTKVMNNCALPWNSSIIQRKEHLPRITESYYMPRINKPEALEEPYKYNNEATYLILYEYIVLYRTHTIMYILSQTRISNAIQRPGPSSQEYLFMYTCICILHPNPADIRIVSCPSANVSHANKAWRPSKARTNSKPKWSFLVP